MYIGTEYFTDDFKLTEQEETTKVSNQNLKIFFDAAVEQEAILQELKEKNGIILRLRRN